MRKGRPRKVSCLNWRARMEVWGPSSPGPAPQPPACSPSIPQHTLLFVILLAQLWSPCFSCTLGYSVRRKSRRCHLRPETPVGEWQEPKSYTLRLLGGGPTLWNQQTNHHITTSEVQTCENPLERVLKQNLKGFMTLWI